MSRSISRILCFKKAVIIYLGCLLPNTSCGTPTLPQGQIGTALHPSRNLAVSFICCHITIPTRGSLTSQFKRLCSHPSPFGGRGLPTTMLPIARGVSGLSSFKKCNYPTEAQYKITTQSGYSQKKYFDLLIRNQICFRFLFQSFLQFLHQIPKHILSLCHYQRLVEMYQGQLSLLHVLLFYVHQATLCL